MTDEERDDYEDEDDITALLRSLGQELRVYHSILQNVDIEPSTEENNGKWEIDSISSSVEPKDEESDEQFVSNDEEKHVDVPGSNFSHKQVLDMVV